MKPIGDIIDALGVTADIADGDLPAAVVVILKVVGDEGAAGLVVAVNEGCSWLEQLGMTEAARQIITTPCCCGGID